MSDDDVVYRENYHGCIRIERFWEYKDETYS